VLHIKTATGERLEIPAYAILAVFKPCDGVNPCAIISDMGMGLQFDMLADQYGFVKKACIDNMAMVNPLEVRLLEQVKVDDDPERPLSVFAEGRMFFPRGAIVGRREIAGDPNGIKAKLFVDLGGKRMVFNVADTLDEMDGVEPTLQPVPVDGRAIAEVLPTPNPTHEGA